MQYKIKKQYNNAINTYLISWFNSDFKKTLATKILYVYYTECVNNSFFSE